jgi:hypothetical protein
VNGRVVSTYPILPGLLNLPVYTSGQLLRVDLFADRERLSLVSAATICALSVLFLFLCLGRLGASSATAFGFAMVYAFGTCVWSVTSRGMWQHGPSLLLLTIALWFLLRRQARAIPWSGLFLGLAFVNRPTNLLIAVPLAMVAARHGRATLASFLALAAVPVGLRSLYAWVYWGNPFSPAQANPIPQVAHFGGNPLAGLAGLLVSPSRGLLVFGPIFFFAALGVAPAIRRRKQEPVVPALLLGSLALLLLMSTWTIWWGGHAFGYRLLIELLPALMVLLLAAWQERIRKNSALKAAFVLCLAWSVYLQFLGAHVYPSGFDGKMDENPAVLWSIRDSEIALSTRKLLSELSR